MGNKTRVAKKESVKTAGDGVDTSIDIENEGTGTENPNLDNVTGDGGVDAAADTEGPNDTQQEDSKEDTPIVEDKTPTNESSEPRNDGQNNEGDLVDNSTPDVKPKTQDPIGEEPKDTPESKFPAGVNLLTSTKASNEEKIEWCLVMAPGKLKSLALQLQGYNDAMKPGNVLDEQKMIGKQYELVSIFRTVFKAETFQEFKSRFDVLNLFFQHYAKEAFASHLLVRFDYLWKWSDKELETLQNVSEVISQLCTAKDRKTNLAKLNLEMALDSEKTIVSEEARNNIIRYYSK